MTITKAYADTPWGQIHYRQCAGPGLPIVFLHRTPSSSVSFEQMMRGMAGERASYAFDTPGFGSSFDPQAQPDIRDYRDWLCAAIDAVGLEQFHLYGHHTGTHIAAEIAAARPQRVRSLMLNGAAYLNAAEREEFRAMVGRAPQPDPEGHYLGQVFTVMKSLFPRWDAKLVHREFCGAMRSTTTRDFAFTAIWDQDFPAVLANVSCPILALSCADDLFIDYLDRIPQHHPAARAAVQGPGRVAAPELATEESIRLVGEFVDGVERA